MVGILVAYPVYIPFTGVENITGKAVPLGGIVPGEFFFCPGGAVRCILLVFKPDDAHDACASEVAAGGGCEGGKGRQQEEGQGEGEGCGSFHDLSSLSGLVFVQGAVGLVGGLDGRVFIPAGIAVLSYGSADGDILKVSVVEIGQGDGPGVPVPYFNLVYPVLCGRERNGHAAAVVDILVLYDIPGGQVGDLDFIGSVLFRIETVASVPVQPAFAAGEFKLAGGGVLRFDIEGDFAALILVAFVLAVNAADCAFGTARADHRDQQDQEQEKGYDALFHGCVPPCSVNSGYTGSIPGRHRHWMSSI